MRESQVMKLVKERAGFVVFSSGYKADSNPYYAYVYMPFDQYMRYQQIRQQGGGFNLAEFGTIIKQGDSLEPSLEVKQEMKQKYNVDEHFESDLKKAAFQAMKPFFGEGE